MKKLLSILILALLLTFAVSAETLYGTLVRGGTADPHLFTDGEYYYLAKTGSTRIAVYMADSISGLASAADSKSIAYCPYYDGVLYDPAIEELYGEGATINGTWSPEIHYFSEEDFPGNSGWYMFVGLRMTPEAGSTYSSEYVRLVVLKATTDDPAGPYGHPTEGIIDYSQPLLDADGNVYDEWACGQSILRIPEGEHAGIYAMWVNEVGRGTSNFYQQIRIAKLETPWKLAEQPGVVTTPTQEWEYAGSEDGTHPKVVEGATAVYGKNGEIFLTYSGSGYWSDYGIGQLTWNGGDPLLPSSWIKYENNPIFTATTAENLRGAGHASFITDTVGNGFFCYHAYPYPYENVTEKNPRGSRRAYIESYSIDYTADNGVSKGVIRLGDGVAANIDTTAVHFELDGAALTTPTVYTVARTDTVTLTMLDSNAEGYLIYRSDDGAVFEYLATVTNSRYVDSGLTYGEKYYYRVYPYREEEIGTASETVSCTTSTCAPYTESATANGNTITVTVHAQDNYETVRLYRSEDGTHFGTGIQEINNVQYGDTLTFTDTITTAGTYTYMASGINYGMESLPAGTVSVTVEITPPTITNLKQTQSGAVRIEVTAGTDYDGINVYHSADGKTYTLSTLSAFHKEISAGGRLSTSVGSLDAGTHYFYATGVVSGVESQPSSIVSFDVVVVEAPVVTVTATCKEITLTWSGDEAYDSYTVYRLTEGELGYATEELATTTESTYTLTDITVGEEYVLGVRGTVDGINTAISMTPAKTPVHNTVAADALAPTCTEDGHAAYSYCSTCGADIVAKETIPATGHSYEMTEEEVPATTASAGKTAVYTCSVCSDSYGGETIPKLEVPIVAGNGDANGDGKTSLLDVLVILHYISDSSRVIDTAAADKNGDGNITIADALFTLQAILNGAV